MENMEMPCVCDCGNWFDLHDGYPSELKTNQVICQECGQKEEEWLDREQEIEVLQDDIDRFESEIEEAQENIEIFTEMLNTARNEIKELKLKHNEQ